MQCQSPTYRRYTLIACIILLAATHLGFAKRTSSCGDPDWFRVQHNQTVGKKLSLLCKGELEAAENHRRAAEEQLNAVIKQAPNSADAYEAHSTLSHFYLRIGRFHDAEAQVMAMLAAKPTAPDLKNIYPLFALLGQFPNLAVSASHPASIRSEVSDGNIFAPVTVNSFPATYMLDTGVNLSLMSESEATRLGLTPQSSTTTLSDISGTRSAALKVVQVDNLTIGATHLRHVPFLVVADTNGAFTDVPPGHRGVLGIQPLLALGTLGFRSKGMLRIADEIGAGATIAPLLFDGELPLTQIVYQGRSLTVTLDLGATQTTLNPPFAKLYPELLRSGNHESHALNGLSGTTTQRSVSLPRLVVSFGREVKLAPAIILLDQTTGSSAWTAANLGYDLMQQGRPFTINFGQMKIFFGQDH